MRVHCTHCGGLIPADDLNIDTALARCRACNAVFSFADALSREAGESGTAAGVATEKRIAPQPRGIRIEDWGGDVRFIRRWFSAKYLFLLFFCIFWDGFLVFWYSMAFRIPNMGDFQWVPILFPLIHVGVGVGLTYSTLCGFINQTTVSVTSGVLSIRHGPLPWLGNRDLPATDFDQLYCRRRISHSRNGTNEYYELHAVLRNGSSVKLLGGLEDPEHALFLEAELERRLGIKDRAVAGEFRG